MPAPTDDISWGTNDNYSVNGDAWDGTPTTVEPSSGRKADGFRPNQRPPAQELAWWQRGVYRWIAYLADFVANLFTTAHEWTETQTFDVPPVAPDYYLSANKTRVFGAGLAHRNVTGDNYSPGGAPPYADFNGPLAIYDPGTGALVKYTFSTDTYPAIWELPLDVGDKITGYGARIEKTSNGSHTVYCKLVAIDNTGAVTDGDSANSVASTNANAPATPTLLSPLLAPVVAVVDGTKRYQLLVYTDGTASGDSVFSVVLDWTHPAP